MSQGIKSAEEIKKDLMRTYDKSPEGWKVSMGRDSENYLNSLFLQENKFWLIKEFPLNPYKSIGIGTRGRIGNREIKNVKAPIDFGLRPLLPEQTKALLEGNSAIIEEILETPPLPSEKCLAFPLVMEGPISLFQRKSFISKAQRELDRKLRKNLRDRISREYPCMARSYR